MGKELKPVGLVIFDCDGVLVDSETLSVAIDVKVLAELGWHLTEQEVITKFVGRSHEYFTQAVEKYLGRPLKANWDDRFQPLYRDAFREKLTAVDGVTEALDGLAVPACVASSGSHEKTRFTLGLTGLYDRFAGSIYSVDDVTRGKPEPDLFLHAAKEEGSPPSQCVVVEDSPFGVEAARKAGMRSLGYCGGLTKADALAGPGTVVFDVMRLLPTLIGQMGEKERQQ